MNRHEWKLAYGAARRNAKGKDCLLAIGIQFWTMLQHGPGDRELYPSIIRDRSPSARVAVELRWSRQYRLAAARERYYPDRAAVTKRGAFACIADCRRIREGASALRALP